MKLDHIDITKEDLDSFLAVYTSSEGCTWQRIERVIGELSEAQRVTLARIAWLGRGDLEDWQQMSTAPYDPNGIMVLLEKRGFLTYLQDGWNKIPWSAKFHTRKEYQEHVTEPTTLILDSMIDIVERTSDKIESYVQDSRARIEADRNILLILYHANSVYTYVLLEDRKFDPWFCEKAKFLRDATMKVAKIWLVELPSLGSGSQSSQRFQEKLDDGLSDIRRILGKLREAATATGMNLVPSFRR